MPLVSAIHDATRVLLNDTITTGGILFLDSVLLPFTKRAYQELQDELALNGLADIIEETSASTSVGIGTKELTGVTLPADLIVPITLWETPDSTGATGWVEMTPKVITLDMQPTTELKYWEWREDAVKFVGATTIRYVKMRYIKSLINIVDTTTTIPIINCTTFLSARIAAMVAVAIGGNAERAGLYQADARVALDRMISTLVKRKQDNPTRRQPFRA